MATLNISDRRYRIIACGSNGSNAGALRRAKINGIDLKNETLESLRFKIDELMGYSKEESSRTTFMFCGRLLIDECFANETLESLGLQNGSYLHVLNRAPKKEIPQVVPEVIGDFKAINLLSTISSTLRSPAFNKVVKKINIDSFIATCPNLAGDRIAQSYLSKPEMLIHLLDPDTIIKVGKNHPGVIEAIEHLSALVQEEAKAVPSGSQNNEISPFSYHMDDMSDEDEEMSDGTRSSNPPPSSSSNNAGGGITLEVLSAALRNTRVPVSSAPASQSNNDLTLPTLPPIPSSPSSLSTPQPMSQVPPIQSSSSATPGPITADIFTQAMAQALGAISQQQQPLRDQGQASQQQQQPDYSSQIATMREMGIVDEGLARRALGVMSGDLQASIDLIFSGWLGEDDSAN
ncbi:ubiquitin-like protein 7 [Lepeophtheirus salmonis]|uniref:ubiquitin-like protein 7 n=1 Tax=Lepeophtheirus salmonis TaxID=72036 RepID=UPI001AE46E93|nr:ubiquitin-like protein 7 [Lepeophtheirus salmonis]